MVKQAPAGFYRESDLLEFNRYFSFDIQPFIVPVSFGANEMIIFEGQKPTSLYYLFSGKAKVYLTKADGKSVLVRFLNAPCFIGEVELLGNEKEALSIKALEDCRCFALPLAALESKLLADVVFLRRMTAYLLGVSSASREQNAKSTVYPLKTRLAGFILGVSKEGRYAVRHTEAADYLGVSYRHLLFVFHSLIESGVLKKEKGGYKITDQAALLALEKQME